MGRSNSCFKLIACGSDAADNEDYGVSEVKDSNDKRGWSFRKRSARHRVLSNTVMTETTSSANKESTECASTAFQPATHSNVVEKIYTTNCSDEKAQLYDEKAHLSDEKVQLSDEKVQQADEKLLLSNEKPQLCSMLDSHTSEEVVVTETESKGIVNPPESSVVVIQTAIRQFLAQRALLKHKNVVKLQAAVRGHLVRSHAIGTLRCVQAIVKMQLLVRARRAQQSHSEKVSYMERDKNDASQTLGTENQMVKSDVTYSAMEKLLSNRFARQLLESTPKNKPIHVKCDPNKANSAWKWLERWMSVSSVDTAESKNTSSAMEQLDNSKDSTSVSQVETVAQPEVHCQYAESKHTFGDSIMPAEDNDQSTTYDSTDFNFQSSHSTSLLDKDNLEQAVPEKTAYDAKVALSEIDSRQGQKMLSDAIVSKEFDALPQKPEIDSEQPKQSMKRYATDQLETEGKKFVYGSKKASNPAFIAAQSKFEELSLNANSSRTSSLSYQDAAVESQTDTPSFGADAAQRTKEVFSLENSISYTSRFAGSECGTELSVTSTLDSPDIYEAGVIDNEHEAKDLVGGEGFSNADSTTNHEPVDDVPCDIQASHLPTPSPVLDQQETTDNINGKTVQTVSDVDTKEQAIKSEENASELQREQVGTILQGFRSSPEASPKSHITVPESQGTPSSQVSLKPKESISDKSGSRNRRRSLASASKSPANTNCDSGSRGSKEQRPKEQLNGKRRNSFGSVRPDHDDQETRDNNSSNSSLPHFMQATESARAKISANNSPRSSPDVHDPDMHIKKRHSLPGATGKRGSPPVQQSTSQPHHGTKGNGVHPPHERKWQR